MTYGLTIREKAFFNGGPALLFSLLGSYMFKVWLLLLLPFNMLNPARGRAFYAPPAGLSVLLSCCVVRIQSIPQQCRNVRKSIGRRKNGSRQPIGGSMKSGSAGRYGKNDRIGKTSVAVKMCIPSR